MYSGSSYSTGSSKTSITINTTQMDGVTDTAHTHTVSGTISTDGAHTHTLSGGASEGGSHTHTVNSSNATISGGAISGSISGGSITGGSISGSVDSVGSGIAFTVNTVPVYYTVVYLMKVA
jgi:hypothetical protein